jgi:hypothetical protein
MKEDVFITTLGKLDGDREAFVLNSWLESYRERGRALHGLSKTEYYRVYHPELTRLLRRSSVSFAALTDDPDIYLGWACGAPGVLHYCYVKSWCRQRGIGQGLIDAVCERPQTLLVYTFEPCTETGEPRRSLLAVAERRGYKYHPHPVPGVEMLKQQEKAS